MLSIKVGTNTKINVKAVHPTSTPKEILDSAGIDMATANTVNLDGATLSSKDMNTPIGELGATDGSYLVSVVKMNNA